MTYRFNDVINDIDVVFVEPYYDTLIFTERIYVGNNNKSNTVQTHNYLADLKLNQSIRHNK